MFAENVVPDFLELHETVMPVLLKLLFDQLDSALQSSDHALSAEKSLFALAEFAANMEQHEIKPYIQNIWELTLKFINN